ncbi:WhiB family transcriptional regulator [Nocardioidaceae bacterium]|nr:WhiB family transcriptional regulator [Nocardioidaceae bacterium]
MSTPAPLIDLDVPSAALDLPCVGRADLFFAEAPDDIERAKAMCLHCPLQQACLEGALDRSEAAGVWGGQLLVAGEVVARKRPRGRPRKHAA